MRLLECAKLASEKIIEEYYIYILYSRDYSPNLFESVGKFHIDVDNYCIKGIIVLNIAENGCKRQSVIND
mgnify:CR=1